MRTISRRLPEGHGPNRVALCSYCGVQYFRSQLTRDASANLACPDCAPGLDIVSLTEGNARLMRSRQPKTVGPSDGNYDQFISPPSPGFVNPNGPPPSVQPPVFPSTIVPLLWLDGRNTATADAAGSVAAIPFAGRVRSISQSLPLTNKILAPSDAVRTYRENLAFNFQIGAAPYMTATASSNCMQNALTIALSMNIRDKPEGSQQSLLCNNANIRIFAFSDNVLTVNYNGSVNAWYIGPSGNLDANAARTPLGANILLVLRISATDMKASVVTNGVRADYVTPASQVVAAATNLPAANWTIGWDGFTPANLDSMLHGAEAQSIVVGRTITDAENDLLIAWMLATQSVRYCPTEIPVVTVSGDSIARAGAGFYGVPIVQSWVMQSQQQLAATQPVNMINGAVSGTWINQQRDLVWPNVLAPFYSPLRSRNVLVMAAGTNDLATLGHTGAVTLADYYAFADLAKAAGWRIVVCTIINRNLGAPFSVQQPVFNAALRAEWAARGYSALADFQAIPELVNPLNLTYYSDGIHPTIAGHAVMAPVARAAIQAALL